MLPLELYKHIFSYTSVFEKAKLCSVNKEFYTIISSFLKYKLVTFAKNNIIKTRYILDYDLDEDNFVESFIDYYSTGKNIQSIDDKEIAQFLEKSSRRIIGTLTLSFSSPRIVGTRDLDRYGWRCGNYGVPSGWYVCVPCLVRNFKEKSLRNKGFIDEYLPVVLFYGKKEGDYINFLHKNKELKLCLSTRRDHEKPFQDVCITALRSCGGVWCPREGEPSEQDQIRMIKNTYEEYASF